MLELVSGSVNCMNAAKPPLNVNRPYFRQELPRYQVHTLKYEGSSDPPAALDAEGQRSGSRRDRSGESELHGFDQPAVEVVPEIRDFAEKVQGI